MLLLTVFSLAIWVSPGVLFRVVADFWIVSDAISPAEAVAVLGGRAQKTGLRRRRLLPKGPSAQNPGIQRAARAVGNAREYFDPQRFNRARRIRHSNRISMEPCQVPTRKRLPCVNGPCAPMPAD